MDFRDSIKVTHKKLVGLPWIRAYLARVRDPILADRSLDLMAAIFWMCLALWGVSSTIAGLPTVGMGLGQVYQTVWGAAIGILCTIAFSAAIGTFFSNPNIGFRIKRKRTEMIWGGMAGGFIAVYPALLVVAAINGDFTRFALFFAALTFLVIPTWRVRHLYHRIRALRNIALATGPVEVVIEDDD